MNLYTIDTKKYKSIFFQTLIPKLLAAATTLFLLKSGINLFGGFVAGKSFTSPILTALVILAVGHTIYQNKKLAKLQQITDFDGRLEEYEKFYKTRLLWFLFSCLVSCVLALLSGRYLFFYFALFDIFISLPSFPNLALFKKELKNEEIVLI